MHNWFSSLPIVTIVYKESGTKFLPEIVNKVPPFILPVDGLIDVMPTSYANSFEVNVEVVAYPNPYF